MKHRRRNSLRTVRPIEIDYDYSPDNDDDYKASSHIDADHHWIELLPDAVCITDLDGNIREFNQNFFTTFHKCDGNICRVIAPEAQASFQTTLHEQKLKVSIAENVKSLCVNNGSLRPAFFDWSFGTDQVKKEMVVTARPSTPGSILHPRTSTATLRSSDDLTSKGLSFDVCPPQLSDEVIREHWSAFSMRAGVFGSPKEGVDKATRMQEKLMTSIQDNNKVFVKKMQQLQQQTRSFVQSEESRIQSNALHEILRHKRAFLRAMMNDVRTPLSVIALGLEHTSSEDPKLIESLRCTCYGVAATLDNYALYENLESGEHALHGEQFNLVSVLHSTAAEFKVLAEVSGVALSVSSEVSALTVCLDRRGMHKALRNLVADAIKYTPAGSSVEVALCLAGQRVRVEVRDGGAGVAQSVLRVAEQAPVKYDPQLLEGDQGTGLGVVVAKRLVNLMGGKTGAYSRSGRAGSASYIEFIPVDALEAESDESARSDTSNLTKSIPRINADAHLRALVVDDSATCRKLMTKRISGHCVHIAEACNGADAVEVFLEHRSNYGCDFDCVLMDFSMPVMTGPAAARQIRDNGYTGKIIMITGNCLAADVTECLAAGADSVYIKPLQVEDFTRLIAEISEASTAAPP